MSDQDEAVRRFWDRYVDYLAKQGVKENARRWYVVRLEHYIKAFLGMFFIKPVLYVSS